MSNDVDRAELIQSLKAFLIPSSLFVATVISAGGTFLLYNGYSLGYLFLAVSATVIVFAFVAFFRFHNKLRAQGHFKGGDDDAAAAGPSDACCAHEPDSREESLDERELEQVSS